MENKMLEKESKEPMRLDKWLWAARFYKTRSMATHAINGGKVHLNGARVKPSRKVDVGDTVEVTVADLGRTVIVERLLEKRGPAKVAVTMYQETEQSIKQREERSEMYKLHAQAPRSDKRPNKKDRRQLRHMKYGD